MEEPIGYSYPDVNDNVTATRIARTERFPGYWEKSNKFINDKILAFIDQSKKPGDRLFLDAGCGDGRLLSEFQGHFYNIIAVEADELRLRHAMYNARAHGYSDKVTFLHKSLDDFEQPDSFDVVLCSHVIQHVHTSIAPVIVKNLCNECRKGGILVLLTTHSTDKEEYFIKSYIKGTEAVEMRISEAEFNALVTNNQNILPIHFYTYQNLALMLQRYGMKVVNFYIYHIEGKHSVLTSLVDLDRAINMVPIIKNKYGRDMMLISIK